jgi:hypothetical protein
MRLLLTFLLLSCAALSPLLLVTLPPMVDLPNHIARVHILDTFNDNPDLQRNYSIEWGLRTYVLPDIVCTGLAKLLPIYWVGKLYVAAAIVACAASSFWLSASLHGRPTVWTFATFLLVFNQPLAWGFINFLLATALALTAFALWVRYEGQPPRAVSIVVAILVLATYLTHIVPIGILGLMLGGYQIHVELERGTRAWRGRLVPWLRIGALFAIPAVLFLAADVGNTVRAGVTTYGSVSSKFRALLSPTLMYGDPIDLGLWFFLVSAFFMGVLARIWTVHRRMQIPLLLLTLAAIALPERLSGTYGLDFRLPVVVFLLLAAAIDDRGMSAHRRHALVASALALFFIRVYAIGERWNEWDAQVREFRSALTTIDRGSRVLSAGSPLLAWYWHLNALAAIERSAFVPTLFTGPTMLRASESTSRIDTPSGTPLPVDKLKNPDAEREKTDGYHYFYWGNWRRDFDYLIWFHVGGEPTQRMTGITPLQSGSFFTIYEITHDMPTPLDSPQD